MCRPQLMCLRWLNLRLRYACGFPLCCYAGVGLLVCRVLPAVMVGCRCVNLLIAGSCSCQQFLWCVSVCVGVLGGWGWCGGMRRDLSSCPADFLDNLWAFVYICISHLLVYLLGVVCSFVLGCFLRGFCSSRCYYGNRFSLVFVFFFHPSLLVHLAQACWLIIFCRFKKEKGL